MAQLTSEVQADVIALVYIDTEDVPALTVAEQVSVLSITEGGNIVASVYWVDLCLGVFDLVVGVRAISEDKLLELVDERIRSIAGVGPIHIEFQFFRYVNGARDGGP